MFPKLMCAVELDMRRGMRFAWLLGVAVVAGCFLTAMPAGAEGQQGQGAATLGNGDANGDDSSLPDTGQFTCRDELGNDLLAADCIDESNPCFGQDASCDTGCSPLDRFLNNGDQTVTDACTGLVWQKSVAGTARTWCGALDYCEGTLDGFAGFSDWRLPNAHELESLVHHGRYDPAIDPVFGRRGGAPTYWTSTSQQGVLAWHDLSEVGLFQTSPGEKAVALRLIRAVRGP
jgi:hypothetical protein